jgi:hypothetical protein
VLAQTAPSAIEGAWHLRIDTPDRPSRYLEILGLQPSRPGRFTATALFGWAGGPISPVTAEISANGPFATVMLRAGTGAKLSLNFDHTGAVGSYTASGQPARAVRVSRLAERPAYGALVGVWRAKRNSETRIFDIKQVLGTEHGAVVAIGQYGVFERPDEVRQMVATVSGEPVRAELVWMTGSSAARLQRTSATRLAGTFEAERNRAGRVDAIVFQLQARPLAAAAAKDKAKPATGSEKGQQFPNFSMVTMDGRTVQLSDFRGKVVLVNMFQSWCIWCIDEMSAFRAAAPRFGDRLVILPVL